MPDELSRAQGQHSKGLVETLEGDFLSDTRQFELGQTLKGEFLASAICSERRAGAVNSYFLCRCSQNKRRIVRHYC